MVQSPSWEANWFAASQEILHISRNPKVHYRTHKRPSPVSILGQSNPVHIPTSHLLEIRSNIIHPSTPRSPQWSLSLRFPHQDPIHPPLLTHTRHMPSPSHSSRFYHPHNFGWGESEHTLCSITLLYLENRYVYEIMWKNVVDRGRPQVTVRLMRIACCVTKATNTHSQYVILIAFPLQYWLHERASMLRYITLPALY